MDIISRKQALKQNLKYYFTGRPCKRNHLSKRKTGCGTCYECHLLLNKGYDYSDKRKATRSNWSLEQKEIDKKNKSVYAKSEKGKKKAKEYLKSEVGIMARRKALENYEESGVRKHLNRYYGISLETYIEMQTAQNGKCKVCGTVPTKRLCVDHCHDSGKIRGLLCSRCNTGIGMLKDSIELVSSALSYLKEYE